jgi:hypothetical protein
MPVPEWPEPTRSPQTLDIFIKGWSFGVSSESLNRFDFEGQCDTSPLKNLIVYGEFLSVENRSSLLQSLPFSWTSMPHLEDIIVEGWGAIHSLGQTYPPTLSFTLFCSSEGLEWVYRAFLAAFAISANSLWPSFSLHLKIEPPDAGLGASGDRPVEDYWRERWQSEPWRVFSWVLSLNVERGDK